MANVVGVFVHNGSSFMRANAGTPTGFSGPAVHNGSSFQNADVVSGYDSGAWRTTWVNIDGEIAVGNLLLTAFDFTAPPSASAQYWVNSDGTIDGQAAPGSPASRSQISSWRQFDCGREYEAYFDEILTGGFVSWNSHPTLDTWLNLTDPATNHTYENESTSQTPRENRMTFKVREKVTAPAGGDDQGNHDTDLDNDTL